MKKYGKNMKTNMEKYSKNMEKIWKKYENARENQENRIFLENTRSASREGRPLP